jgi:hypothetical protein
VTEKSALESLPMQVSQSEIAERNRKHWNTPHEIAVPPVAPAPAPPVSPAESRFPKNFSVPQLVELGTGTHGAPNDIPGKSLPRSTEEGPLHSQLPERITQKELAETFLSPSEHSDQVNREPIGASSTDPNGPVEEKMPPWRWWGPR